MVTARAHGATGTATLSLRLLGGFRLSRGDEVIPDDVWVRRKTRTVLKLLAVEPSHRLHREQIEDLLWPDLDPAAANRSVRKALHEARFVLEPELARGAASRYLLFAGDVLRLNAETVTVDADQFEHAARQALLSGEVADLEAAVALYGGELLPEDRYEDWAALRRDALAALATRVLLRLAETLEERGQRAAAIEWLLRALERDRANEELHRHLMCLHAAGGNHHAALRQYAACRQALSEELDATPEPETIALYDQIRAGSTLVPVARPGLAPLPPALRRTFATHFVGRERALALLLDDPLARAPRTRSASGQGGIERRPTIFVGGEAGVGKTRLVTEAGRTLYADGVQVLWGTCTPHARLQPYGPFTEALERVLLAQAPETRAALARELDGLGRLLPSLAGNTLPRPIETAGQQTALFSTVARLLDALSQDAPLFLVLEDLHSADAGSLELLHHLSRLAPERPWLLAGTFREEEVPGTPLEALLGSLRHEGVSRHVDLFRLGRPDSDRLVQSLLAGEAADPAVYERLHALSLGNPLFLGELVRTMQHEGDLIREEGRWALAGERAVSELHTIPQQVRDLVETRVRGLGSDVRQTLMLAAAAGMEAPFALLATAAPHAWSELDEERVLDGLDRALEAHLLEERRSVYTFRHPLFREALYARTSGPRRVRLHRALGTALEAVDREDVEGLAHHWSRAEDDERAINYLEQAAERARALYANAIAIAHYRDLIERLDRLGRTVEAADARRRLGALQIVAGAYEEAQRELTLALAILSEAGDAEAVGRAVALMAQLDAIHGAFEEGAHRARLQIEAIDATFPGSPVLAELHSVVANLEYSCGQFARALSAAERAAQLAETLGDDWLRARAAQTRAMNLVMLGRVPEGREALEEAVVLFGRVGEIRLHALQLSNVGELLQLGGHLEAALDTRVRALAIAERAGDPAIHAFIESMYGYTLMQVGRWAEARTAMQRGLARLERIAHRMYTGHAATNLATLERFAGEWEVAATRLRGAVEEAARAGNAQIRTHAQYHLAEIERMQGLPGQARQRLEAELADPVRTEVQLVVVHLGLARAYFDEGNLPSAATHIAEAERLAVAHGAENYRYEILRTRAVILARQGNCREACGLLHEAIQCTAAMPYPYLEARCRLDLGRILWDMGNVAEGRAEIERALAGFRCLGAAKDAEEAIALLSR